MFSCDEAAELLSARLDGPLSPADAEKLNAHLAQCPTCRAIAEDLARMHRVLPDLVEELPEGLHQAILDRIQAERAGPAAPLRHARPVWRRWAALAAVFALVILGAWGAFRMSGGQETGNVSDTSLMAPGTGGGGETVPMPSGGDAAAGGDLCDPSAAPDTAAPARTPKAGSAASAGQPGPAASGGTGEQSALFSLPAAAKRSVPEETAPPEESAPPEETDAGTTGAGTDTAAANDAGASDTEDQKSAMLFLAPAVTTGGGAASPAVRTEEDAGAALQAELDKTDTAGELTALGLSPNGLCYEFSLSGADGAEKNRYAVPLDGGEIVPLFLSGEDGTPADNGTAYHQAVGSTDN